MLFIFMTGYHALVNYAAYYTLVNYTGYYVLVNYTGYYVLVNHISCSKFCLIFIIFAL